MRRRFTLLLVLVFSVGLLVPGVAEAHHWDGYSPIIPFGSQHHSGETLITPVGETLEFGSRWGACTRGLAKMYTNVAEVMVTVEHEDWDEPIELDQIGWMGPIVPEQPISDASFEAHCRMPVKEANGYWVFWSAPYTFTEVGTYTVRVEVSHRSAVFDGGILFDQDHSLVGEVYIDVRPALSVVVHENPWLTEFMEKYNADFEAAQDEFAVDMTVVAPREIATAIEEGLAAQELDIIDYCVSPCAGFSNRVQPYMLDVDPTIESPMWQRLIEDDLILEITDEPFVENFDEAAIRDAASVDGSAYGINMGRIAYSGMFVNLDLLTDLGVALPTTWSELVAACETVQTDGYQCMTVGGADTWPVFVGSYGILGAMYPDQAGLVEGLWKGDIQWDDVKGLELFEKYHSYATEMLEAGAGDLGHDEATWRFAEGDVAFMPTGSWQAGNLEDAEPAFDWTYVAFPGSDDPADNQYLFGKYDFNFMIAADTPHPDLAKAYLAGLSDPETYQEFVNETGFIPTQPTATLGGTIGSAIAPYLEDRFLVGFEQHWVSPSCAGMYANGSQAASWFPPFGDWERTSTELASQAQVDLEYGLVGCP